MQTRSHTKATKNVPSVSGPNVPGPSKVPQSADSSLQLFSVGFMRAASEEPGVYEGALRNARRRRYTTDFQVVRRRHGRLEGDKKLCSCGKYFRKAVDLTRHLNEKILGKIKCNQVGCWETFSLEMDANNHQERRHGKPDVVCMGCRKFFPSAKILKKHRSGCKKERIQTGKGYASIRESEEDDFLPNYEL